MLYRESSLDRDKLFHSTRNQDLKKRIRRLSEDKSRVFRYEHTPSNRRNQNIQPVCPRAVQNSCIAESRSVDCPCKIRPNTPTLPAQVMLNQAFAIQDTTSHIGPCKYQTFTCRVSLNSFDITLMSGSRISKYTAFN